MSKDIKFGKCQRRLALGKGALLLSACWGLMAQPTFAQDVTLTTRSGDSKISGEFVGYDGHSYRIKTVLGEMSVEADLFECVGAACPDTSRLDGDLTIVSNYDRIGDLSFSVLSNVVQKENADVLNNMSGASGSFTLKNSDAEIAVTVGHKESKLAFEDLINGRADVILVNRMPTSDEVAQAKAAGLGDLAAPEQQKIVVEDAASIVVGDRVNLRALSKFDLADVFSGAIADWSEFGLSDGAVTLYGTDSSEGSHEVFMTRVMDGQELASSITLLPTSEEVLSALANDPNGIGFLNHTIARNGGQSVIALEDQCGRLSSPNDFSIKMGQYPLSSVIYAYTAEKTASRLGRAFHAETASVEGQAFLSAFNLIDSLPATYSIDSQGRRILQTVLPTEVDMTLEDTQKFFAELEFADRLSIDLIYEQGTGELIESSARDLQKLANMLKKGAFDGKEVLFVGFTDSIGRPDINRETSEERANGVLERFETMIPPEKFRNYSVSSVGFGELSPLYCNDEPAGRAGNRRVEIWVREKL